MSNRYQTCLRTRFSSGRGARLPESEAMDSGIYVPERIVYLGNVTYTDEGEEVGIDSALAERVVGGLIYLNRQNRKPIRMLMNTSGGLTTSGFAIYDAIRSSRSPVDIEVLGEASSMGALILQAGRTRLLHPNTLIMIHEGKMGSLDSRPREHEAWAEWSKTDREKMYHLLGEKTKKPAEYWKDVCARRQEVIFDAKRAVDIGLADKIIEPAPWTRR